jgi:hypothetical protein
MKRQMCLSAAALALTLGSGAFAQDGAGGANPTDLRAGFRPDPIAIDLMAGGTDSASDRRSGCAGSISSRPNYSVNFKSGPFPLIFSADSQSDTTLVIRGPDSQWYCDDDGAEEPFNPLIEVTNPQSGQYDIWVGTFGSTGQAQATLFISERGEFTRESAGLGDFRPPPPPPPPSSAGLNANLSPRYQQISLTQGYLPDPHSISVQAGGAVHLPGAISNASGTCAGYSTREPTVELSYSGSTDLHIYTQGSSDTTLAVRGPRGNWSCNDDNIGLNAGVSFTPGQSGTYDVYVGTFSGGTAQTTLQISEISMGYDGSSSGSTSSGGALNISASAALGNAALNANFLPDPFERSVRAGGSVALAGRYTSANGYCTGYTTTEPTLELNYTGSSQLHIYTAGSADTTLIVNAPDGSWHCNDDAVGLNAGLSFTSATRGVYDIYVGTFGERRQRTTLRVSEISLGYGG